jgi:hypothetical protein
LNRRIAEASLDTRLLGLPPDDTRRLGGAQYSEPRRLDKRTAWAGAAKWLNAS